MANAIYPIFQEPVFQEVKYDEGDEVAEEYESPAERLVAAPVQTPRKGKSPGEKRREKLYKLKIRIFLADGYKNGYVLYSPNYCGSDTDKRIRNAGNTAQ